ncbi:hypothetical protein A3A76_00970 [Candidatus Woesebacteria bacterium RIFCSPLOWO2_01_FULL_39_23]|uniref:Uncharacterized protein n=1 Tax=Candidatus Woesebacteria bacterium RIFCSPHIGHO2_01_FULL_40_22 TaxID=1802499 RepID=A0A1F7YHN1_9BACT|nr:MAG: hypothetical protein A2141_05615 [Candidatus Woesebacteria bacterium RBG_16_40_11]OGM26813.1 MAG: hypothetical protein A2628_04645 [Candidatus Woesebacteria bacterium RIFCSPHIGHO2_01_FULL_40_22]OGM38383.1 MAG: hypothetical protein A3E41_02460 [Candidatus Woesebacteria bacterium RIFCSPHIGHO2_12_FULL_38_9]OGM63110.1 MAG: hypothetical protein A3A76_00970 [Candidatus Woesebacteria bacterium RIFCSPLOWO2_01_FULL_39_23]
MKYDHEQSMDIGARIERMVARATTHQVLTNLATELEAQGKPIPAQELREAGKSFYQKALARDKKLASST